MCTTLQLHGQICMHHQLTSSALASLNVMICGLVWGLLSSLISCFVSSAQSQLDCCCQDAVIIPAQTWHLATALSHSALYQQQPPEREPCSRTQHGCSIFLHANVKLALCFCRLAEPKEHWHRSVYGQCSFEDPLLPSVASHQAGKLAFLCKWVPCLASHHSITS
jgi:hypothetical protein